MRTTASFSSHEISFWLADVHLKKGNWRTNLNWENKIEAALSMKEHESLVSQDVSGVSSTLLRWRPCYHFHGNLALTKMVIFTGGARINSNNLVVFFVLLLLNYEFLSMKQRRMIQLFPGCCKEPVEWHSLAFVYPPNPKRNQSPL